MIQAYQIVMIIGATLTLVGSYIIFFVVDKK